MRDFLFTAYVVLFSTLVGLLVSGGSPGVETVAEQRQTPSKADPSYQDRKAWRQVLHWPESCEEGFHYPNKSWGGLRFYKLADQKYLVEVTCTLGAYQGFQMYFYLDEAKSSPPSRFLTFETYEAIGRGEKSLVHKRTSELWGTPEFNPRTKQLTVLNRFRGLGDCGSFATYEFRSGNPVLKGFRAKLTCDGRGGEDPIQWKKVR